jgi:K+-transporting ATPase ATPase A chain
MFAWAELAGFLILLTALTPVLGGYLVRVFEGPPSSIMRLGRPFEQWLLRVCRVDPAHEMTWWEYLAAVLSFSAVSAAALFALLCTQAWLPLNPQHFVNLPPVLAFNVAVSFMTTTDWQAYSGESTLSYLAQMAGLGWQNFTAAAIGLAVALAIIRGFTRTTSETLGNFWVDLTRSIFYVLVPLSVAGAVFFVAQGMPQNFTPYQTVTTIEGAPQTIIGGPIASQDIIKQLGVRRTVVQ